MSDRFEYGIESDYAMEDGSGSSLRGVREKWKMIWGGFFFRCAEVGTDDTALGGTKLS